jgi:DNA repair protein SbcD/Mre11
MIKIAHTADWHIGKILHRQELTEEMSLFFDWLVDYIRDEDIDVLLVAGDIFDLANPSNRDERLYFETISRFIKLGVRVIITGGNHDSISLLDKPNPLLDALNVTVVGGGRADIEDEIVPIYDVEGKVVAAVLAVPFLRDKDIRRSVAADMNTDKAAVIGQGIKRHYDTLISIAKAKYGNHVPIVAMGHLYIDGAMKSDSERDIHIGNLGGLDHQWISPDIGYFALGHIHKPQRIAKQDHIRYSGSPIFLDFSESAYQKLVIRLDIDHTIKTIEPVEIPIFRKLIRLSGSLEEIATSLYVIESQCNEAPSDVSQLRPFVELKVSNPDNEVMLAKQVEQFVTDNSQKPYKIIKTKIASYGHVADNGDTEISMSIDELSPEQVFYQCMNQALVAEGDHQALLMSYQVILDSIHA